MHKNPNKTKQKPTFKQKNKISYVCVNRAQIQIFFHHDSIAFVACKTMFSLPDRQFNNVTTDYLFEHPHFQRYSFCFFFLFLRVLNAIHFDCWFFLVLEQLIHSILCFILKITREAPPNECPNSFHSSRIDQELNNNDRATSIYLFL